MSKRLNKLFACLLILSLTLALVPAQKHVNAATSELFISEYIEGSYSIKRLRSITAQGPAVDLVTYTAGACILQRKWHAANDNVGLSGTLA